jgi:hypothetical protein
MRLGAARKLDHGVDDALVVGNGGGCAHVCDLIE